MTFPDTAMNKVILILMQDFKELVAAAKEAGIKLLMESQLQRAAASNISGDRWRFDHFDVCDFEFVDFGRSWERNGKHLKVLTNDSSGIWIITTVTLEYPLDHWNTSCVNSYTGMKSRIKAGLQALTH